MAFKRIVKNISMQKTRESQFELMRIIAMVFIVFYHLFLDTTEHLWGDQPIYQGIQIPIHFGVLLFVMISGYFGIKPTFRGGGADY